MAYFERTGPSTFRATEHTGGAWTLDEQHIAPALGLLAHVVERDRDHRHGKEPGQALPLCRLSFDILGVLPIEDVDTEVKVVRPGRSIELVEARLIHGGRPAVVLRAWLMQTRDTTVVAGTPTQPLPGPAHTPEWDPTTVWPGGFIKSAHLRRQQQEPGRAHFWVRTDEPLVDEPFSPTAAAIGLLDIANGMTVREDPQKVAFPNLDLTAHLTRAPRPGWVGFDTSVTFGDNGIGLTSTVLHDEDGPIGTLNQILTVRPTA
ncbi:hypothetical protein N802_05420 [Knoellia sinensis KCTC 19936]|uniref:Thioesterase n=1 Tax=Knoellia sinensis KCTC 19936 TaxID=1385520 RepID=A0A0A0J642_9MICO|nr:thioesterase family protein [Knoellia sinensis]KGN31046.1 hypothetical protein N802_05420 [Knoellia sinensis KCTC 19936]